MFRLYLPFLVTLASIATHSEAKTLIGTSTPLTATLFCREYIPSCKKIVLEDASAEVEMQSMYAASKFGDVDIRYSYHPTQVIAASINVPIQKMKKENFPAISKFLSEWAGFQVGTAQFMTCTRLDSYAVAKVKSQGNILVECQNRDDLIQFLVTPKS